MIGLLALAIFGAPAASRAASVAIGISVGIAPPPIPVYAQPVCPGPGYMWTPGYWAYDPADGYYWVPGTWVVAPAPGLLWTPGYWGWGGAAFIWHAGYWGPHVGFYGGINYGFGYTGVGFVGGEWRGRTFFYNRSVNNFGSTRITNVYYRPVVNNFSASRVSYNGGAGGLSARPSSGELAAKHERHIEATSLQRQHEVAAHNDRSQFASINHGRPGVAATSRPGEFRGTGVAGATRAGGTVNPAGKANPHRPGGYTGNRNPNAGGGGTRQARTTPGQYHATPSHNQSPHGTAPTRQAMAHTGPSPEHTARPAGGEKKEPHEGEARR